MNASRRGGIVKGEAVAGVVAALVIGLVATLTLVWWVALIGWTVALALGGSFLGRRISVTDEHVVEHRLLFLNKRYSRSDIVAIAVRSTAIGEIGLPAAAPYLSFSTGRPDRRLLALMQYAFTNAGNVKAAESAHWLADALGVPVLYQVGDADPEERAA
jgi:hypothetical protein